MPWTTSSLIEMQVTAGKGGLPRHAVGIVHKQRLGAELGKQLFHRGVDLGVVTPGRTIGAGDLVGLPDDQPGLRRITDDFAIPRESYLTQSLRHGEVGVSEYRFEPDRSCCDRQGRSPRLRIPLRYWP